jgi:chemotaxis protein methyltransferase CheR
MALSSKDFDRLSNFIYGEFGIKMPSAKHTMLEGRLSKRLRLLDLSSYSEYCDFLFSDAGKKTELVHLINNVTTNKTDFFREPSHFDYLTRSVLPDLADSSGAGVRNKLKIWSAGCSTGEEPYTLTMVLGDYSQTHPEFSAGYSILATDISTRVLQMAKNAVYHQDRIEPVTQPMRKKYLLKSKDRNNPVVRIVPELRSKVTFGQLNFMVEDFGLREQLDIIFCRNVIIYFDKETQEKLMNKFCRNLVRGGYLFLGHSESLHGYDLPLVQVAPTVYQRQ